MHRVFYLRSYAKYILSFGTKNSKFIILCHMLSFPLSFHKNLCFNKFSFHLIHRHKKTRGESELNMFNNLMSIKISWKHHPLPCSTEGATQQWTSNLKQSFKDISLTQLCKKANKKKTTHKPLITVRKSDSPGKRPMQWDALYPSLPVPKVSINK